MERRSALDRVIEAVSDGTPVDWEAAAAGELTPDERTRLVQLRVLEDIVRFHQPELDATVVAGRRSAAEVRLGSWGNLELRGVLGSGAFGRVYEAWDPKLEREVALKLVELSRLRAIDPGSYLREGRLMARVRHANVAQVHGADIIDGSAGIWMELVRGKTLESQLADEGPFGESEAARIGVELCRGLAAVHAAGLVHRDVKTSNVMRERGGRIVLMDLGAGFDAATEIARAADTTGTPFYMAPEIWRGAPATARSDLYSLGIVLFRLVCARFPVDARTPGELVEAYSEGRRHSLRDLRPELSPGFIRVVERSIAIDSSARFASAGEMQAALESFAVVDRPPERPARRRFALGAAAVVALAAVAAALFLRFRPVPFHVEAELYRTTERGVERLVDGDAVGPGDRLSMTFRASERVYAYVLNQDESGEIYLLFPLAGLEPGNPLPGGALHRLPGSVGTRPQVWVASGGDGNERFLIVASRDPLSEFDADLAALARPTADSGKLYARLSESSERRLRSVSGLIDDEPSAAPTAVFDRLEQLGNGQERSSGVWIRRFKLRSR